MGVRSELRHRVTCDRCREGVLDVAAVAERLGMEPGSVMQARWRQAPTVPPEDGVVSGRPWWWPATVDEWKRKGKR